MTETTSNDTGDYLSYGVYAETLWARVERALDKDLAPNTEIGDDPLVVGIFGEWGAGKSKLLSLVKKRAEANLIEQIKIRSGEDGDGGNAMTPLTIPVYFQPWKYEHEKHLLIPMLLHILAQVESTLPKANTAGEVVLEGVGKVGDKVVNVFRGLGDRISKLSKEVKTALIASEPLTATALLAGASLLSKMLGSAKKLVTPANQFSFKDDGRSYYDMHVILKEITRPGHKERIKGAAHLHKETRINFVIFIDDLDRCLPEKAVETLELIKTIFNLESFAFVLALDEEVVERGIAHRYKDYGLANKKSDMPITGFEYLEKIVHLPFRLPALARADALTFIQEYEKTLIEQRQTVLDRHGKVRQAWFVDQSYEGKFDEQVVEQLVREKVNPKDRFQLRDEFRRSDSAKNGSIQLNLAHFVLNSFSAYVPRKLVRIVELFHHTLDVLEKRERVEELGLGERLDPRMLIAFVLLQLFHPDLYRICRRTNFGFDTLRDDFRDGKLSKSFSDMDLMHWACYLPENEDPPRDMNELMRRISAIKNRDGERSPAERVRLPLVRSIIEHRAAGRHVFDPLAMFEALQSTAGLVSIAKDASHHYFGLLGKVLPSEREYALLLDSLHSPAPTKLSDNAGTNPVEIKETMANSYTVDITDFSESIKHVEVQAVFRALISSEEREQEGVLAVAGLAENEKISSSSIRGVVDLCRKWLDQAKSDEVDQLIRKMVLLRGLQYLAPALKGADFASADGLHFWELVKESVDTESIETSVVEKIDPKDRALWGNVRSALGQDTRFNSKFHYLPKDRFASHTETQEPIPGFVHTPANTFAMGNKDQSDNQPRVVYIAKDFYIARYLTTVDQYACFLDAKGYENDAFWNDTGREWRTGRWDSKIKEKAFKDYLALRPIGASRQQPIGWAEQRTNGSKPVHGVNWFEAFAYTQWLQTQKGFEAYKAHLPTEKQWERVARAVDGKKADERDYPWAQGVKEDEKTAHLYANIGSSGIKQASMVGLFPPSSIGLYDILGNLLEWQGNLYNDFDKTTELELLNKQSAFKTAEEWSNCDRPALRGGSWSYSADFARTGYRYGDRPDFWSSYIGFRVVLSQA